MPESKHEKKTLLVDASYIHTGGNKTLLLYLMEQLHAAKANVYYLLDDLLGSSDIPPFVTYEKISGFRFLQRHRFFTNNKNRFDTIFCFNNLPPTTKMAATTITYLHSTFYFPAEIKMPATDSFVFYLKRKIFGMNIRNADRWMVQTPIMRRKLTASYKIQEQNILELPFYRLPPAYRQTRKEKSTFLYASDGLPHKNHELLISAFCCFFDRHQTGKLTLTVSSRYPNVLQLIHSKKEQGYPIENIGFVAQEELFAILAQTEFYIHPSLTESFGLGLIEAAECNCKILGADKPYTYQVCTPSAVFDPLSGDAVFSALERAVLSELPESKRIVGNNIAALIKHLT